MVAIRETDRPMRWRVRAGAVFGCALGCVLLVQFWMLTRIDQSFGSLPNERLPHDADSQNRAVPGVLRKISKALATTTSPTRAAFDWQPWRDAAGSLCDAIFGNGFTDPIVRCPQVACDHNPTTHSTFCIVKDLTIDLSRITVSAGGERIEDVIGRDENAEYPVYVPGALSTADSCSWGEINDNRFPNHLAAMVRSFTHGQSVSRSACRDGITLLITRYEYANLYHTMADWYNAFQTWSAVPDSVSTTVQIIFMDGHSRGSLDPVWATLFGATPIFVSSLSSQVCFRNAVLVPPGYTGAFSVDVMPIAESCQSVPLVNKFADWFVTRFGLQDAPRHRPTILFVLRRDYLAHPRNQGRSVSRKIRNEGALLERTAASFPHADVRTAEFEKLRFVDQIAAIRGATVIVGVHGAALSHILLAQKNSTLVELMPPEYTARMHFYNFAKYAGIEYERVEIGPEQGGGFHQVPIDDVLQVLRRIIPS